MLTIANKQQSKTIPSLEARRRLGEPSMKMFIQTMDYIIEHKPKLADRLAISLDNELRDFIESGIQEAETGALHPIESILDE